jgi:hypothetical protein
MRRILGSTLLKISIAVILFTSSTGEVTAAQQPTSIG